MSQRFYVYPLLFTVLLQLAPLLRRPWRSWFAAQISQLLLVLVASLGAVYFNQDFEWVIVAWLLYLVFVVAPKALARLAARALVLGLPDRAARWWQLAGRLLMGHWGRLYRRHAAALKLWSAGDEAGAVVSLEQLAAEPMPDTVHGEVRLGHLMLLTSAREWPRAVAFYQNRFGWGALGTAMQARLLAARAYAELGQFEPALRCLQFVALSPRTLGALERQLWMARVCVAALAGDEVELESLLQRRGRGRGWARFAAYWRGRSALVRGNRDLAGQQLTRALSLTPPRLRKWREATAGFLQEAESGTATAPAAVGTDAYRHGQNVLRLAEQQAASWRALMQWGRPGVVTLSLLVVISLVFLVDEVVFAGMLDHPLWLWAGNVPDAVRHGEWWRATTTLFLHANTLHWAMNGAALWMFGSAVEKATGRWRFLVVFLVGGTLANLASAWTARYDVSVGASGGIFAVLGAFLVAVFRLRSPIYAAVRRRLLVLLAVMIVADLTIGGLEPQVDNLAHGGGFVVGCLIAWLLRPRRTPAAQDTL